MTLRTRRWNSPARSTATLAANLAANLAASLLLTSCGVDDALPPTSDAPPPTGDVPTITGERLLAVPPPGWTRTFELDDSGVRLVEFMPPDSDPEQWVDKVSFESFTDDSSTTESSNTDGGGNGEGSVAAGDALRDPITLVRNIAKQREQDCAGFEDYNTFSGLENNYPTSVRLLLCHRNRTSGLGEIAMLKSIQGNTDFYLIQRTRQVQPYEDPQRSPMDDDEIGQWSLYFRSISVCDDTRPEHPCPASNAPEAG